MKFNKKNIMKRAWEIKKEADRKTTNSNYNLNIYRPLESKEKALFSECLKLAWAEAMRANALAQTLEISIDTACKLAAKETEANEELNWRIWSNYGKVRAYYTIPGLSKYQNNKGSYVSIA